MIRVTQSAYNRYQQAAGVDLPAAKRGPREMNKWEAAYADFLEMERIGGAIWAWHYEGLKFRLARATSYTPDFIVVRDMHMESGIEIEAVEIKGFRRSTGIAKFKIAREMYPWIEWRMVTKKGGEWVDVKI